MKDQTVTLLNNGQLNQAQPQIDESFLRIYETIIGAVLATTESVVGVIKSAEPEISLLEVAQHDSFNDCWIVIYDRVYDVTKFLHSVSNVVGPAGMI